MESKEKVFIGSSMIKKYWLVFFLTLTNVNFLISQINDVFYTQFQEIFQLTNTQQGVLAPMNYIGCIIGSIIGGYLADRYSPKLLCVLSCIVSGVASIIEANIRSYSLLLLIYLLLSLSCFVLLNTAYMKCIKMLGTEEEQGKLFGVSEASFGAVTLIFYSGFLSIISSSGMNFQQALYLVGGLCIVIGVLLQIFFKLPKAKEENKEKVTIQKPGFDVYIKAVKMPITWYNGLVFYGVSSFMTMLFSYMQPRLVNIYLFDAALASAILLVVKNVLRIILSPIGGTIRDKAGDSFKVFIPMGVICIILSAMVAVLPVKAGASPILYLILIIAASVLLFCITPLQYTLVTDAKVPECYSGTVWGISYAINPLLGLPNTVIAGYLLDKFGLNGYRYIAVLMGVFMIVVVLATALMRRSIKMGTVLGKAVKAEIEAGEVV